MRVRVTYKPVDKSRIQASDTPDQRLPLTTPESARSSLWNTSNQSYLHCIDIFKATLASGQEEKSKWPSVMSLEQPFWKLGLHLVQAVLNESTERGKHLSPQWDNLFNDLRTRTWNPGCLPGWFYKVSEWQKHCPRKWFYGKSISRFKMTLWS